MYNYAIINKNRHFMTPLRDVTSDQMLAEDYPLIPSALQETAQAMQQIATSQIPPNPYADSNPNRLQLYGQILAEAAYPLIPIALQETAQAMQQIATSQILANPDADSNPQRLQLSGMGALEVALNMRAFEVALDSWIESNPENYETKNNDDLLIDPDSVERAQKHKQEHRKRIKRRNTLCCCCRSLYRAWLTCKQSIAKAR